MMIKKARNKQHNFRKNTSLKRKENILETKKLFIVACEGEKTEPNYLLSAFEYLKKNYKIAQGSFIVVGHRHSDPCGVLNDLITSPDYLEIFDEKWIVIDRDEILLGKKGVGGHTKTNFCKALTQAAKLGVNVAWSNPCFELWLFLHFNYLDTAVTRKEIQKKVLACMKKDGLLNKNNNIRSMKSIKNLFELLLSQQEKALHNAHQLMDNNVKKPENCNPGTSFHILIEMLETLIK